MRIYPALVLNDYEEANYATWFKQGIKLIETRMGARLMKHRGDTVICCGKTNSVTSNAGKALCIVNFWHGRPMKNEAREIQACCIGYDEKRIALLAKDWRYFNRYFDFAPCAVKKNFQGIFSIALPDDILIIPQPQIIPYQELEVTNKFFINE